MPYRRSGETLEVRTAAGAHEIVTTLDGLEVRGPDNTHIVVTRTKAMLRNRERILIPEVGANTLHIEPWALPEANLLPIEDR